MHQDDFNEFLKVNQARRFGKNGYMFIRLDKDDGYYAPGETVMGTIFFELFDRTSQIELCVKFQGE